MIAKGFMILGMLPDTTPFTTERLYTVGEIAECEKKLEKFRTQNPKNKYTIAGLSFNIDELTGEKHERED